MPDGEYVQSCFRFVSFGVGVFIDSHIPGVTTRLSIPFTWHPAWTDLLSSSSAQA